MVSIPPHYPFLTRLTLDLWQSGALPNVRDMHIEPEYGRVGRIVYQDGSVRWLRGANVDANRYGASELANDKGHTKFFLQHLGYHTPPGRSFLMPHFAHHVDQYIGRYGKTDHATTDDILSYIDDALGGYPCFLKPHDGAQGKGVYKCYNAADVQAALATYAEQRLKIVLVEADAKWPDYRIVVYGDEMVACYARLPLRIVGDGIATVAQLMQQRDADMTQKGRSARVTLDDDRIRNKLTQTGLMPDDVLAAGQVVALHDVANLSAGGEGIDLTAHIHDHWRELAIQVTRDMGLTLCGVDIACADINDPQAAYHLIELNASPSLSHYAKISDDTMQRVRDFYGRLLNMPRAKT